ncbi:MAG: leucine--tRNA ligase [Bdellovibrionaceae bacterium]|nr:leucine--tRNA ligase [Pseudobdellovibrionaceae bacterium]|tara:strand:- start:63603 stop:65993 length:2391 start_codon:yes stop_codon:yes gene_type:complete
MSYDHLSIEKKWQDAWDQDKIFKAVLDKSKPKYYVLDMFPYPSSTGLHVGHPEGYTATDIVSRYKRSKGFNVLHPMGYDAFGLPAEQYAIKTGIHPKVTTDEAIVNFRKQLKMLGFSYDWEREISTCDPKFFKWTQFIFKKLYEKGLAYQKEVAVNWCPALKTVLANEEVVDGKSERGGHPVFKKPMKQWMLKITEYAEQLIEDLDKVDWPERTKEAQKNWIGKSVGARIEFAVENFDKNIEVFTTRPDTLFGASFMVLAPEHPFVEQITSESQKAAVADYKVLASQKSEIDRQANQEKTGCFTGAYAIHPITKEQVPVWISDYVLMGYGTGAIMAVPAHDERDFEFASKFDISIKRVVEGEGDLPFSGEGKMINSDFLNGLDKAEAIAKMIEYAEENSFGEKQVQYKLRDWLFSRQRYWGEPFPVVHYPNGDLKLVPDNELPVLLPEVADYEPSDSGESPLGNAKEWRDLDDGGFRETDTMPGSAGSSWYFLRYCDPHNDSEAFSFEAQDYWMPVDLYLGGPEHTVGHLLYSRFWQKVLFDAGLVSHVEPFQKLIHQGMILGDDGEKMSKSRGNVVNPDDIVNEYGADALRLYEMFMGPLEKDKPWSNQGVQGVRRFLERIYRLVFDEQTGELVAEDIEVSEDLKKSLHKTIKKVTEDIEALSFNTAISQMMILTNDLYKAKQKPKALLKDLSVLLMPFAPHLAEEIWKALGGEGYASKAEWPSYDESLVKEDTVSIGVQVNGKMRGSIELSLEATEDQAVAAAKEIATVQNAIGEAEIRKVIYRAGKILNIIAK